MLKRKQKNKLKLAAVMALDNGYVLRTIHNDGKLSKEEVARDETDLIILLIEHLHGNSSKKNTRK